MEKIVFNRRGKKWYRGGYKHWSNRGGFNQSKGGQSWNNMGNNFNNFQNQQNRVQERQSLDIVFDGANEGNLRMIMAINQQRDLQQWIIYTGATIFGC